MKTIPFSLVLSVLLSASTVSAEDEVSKAPRGTYIRCAAIFSVVGVASQGTRRGEAHAAGALLFGYWAAESDQTAGAPSKAATDAVARDMAAQVLEFAKGAKPGSSSQETAQYIVQSNVNELEQCVELFRLRAPNQRDAQ